MKNITKKYKGSLEIGMKVYLNDINCPGTVIEINYDGYAASILRDDGDEGDGVMYNGCRTWRVRKEPHGFWGSSGIEGFLWVELGITNWRKRIEND